MLDYIPGWGEIAALHIAAEVRRDDTIAAYADSWFAASLHICWPKSFDDAVIGRDVGPSQQINAGRDGLKNLQAGQLCTLGSEWI